MGRRRGRPPLPGGGAVKVTTTVPKQLRDEYFELMERGLVRNISTILRIAMETEMAMARRKMRAVERRKEKVVETPRPVAEEKSVNGMAVATDASEEEIDRVLKELLGE